MKRAFIYPLILLFLACTESQGLSPAETSKKVIESFYNKENKTLRQYTTQEGYDGLILVQNLITRGKSGNSDFKVLQKTKNDSIAWIKFRTSYEKEPELFKLLKKEGQWKVTQQEAREKGPF